AMASGTMTAQTASPARKSGTKQSRRYAGSQPRMGSSRAARETRSGGAATRTCRAFVRPGRPPVPIQPAPPIEQRERGHQGRDEQTDPEDQKHPERGDALDQPLEVHAEEPREKGQRQEDGREDRQAVDDSRLPVGDARPVAFHGVPNPLAEIVDL